MLLLAFVFAVFSGSFVTPAPFTQLSGSYFISNETEYYSNYVILCDDNYDCNIQCLGDNTCKCTRIVCPSTNNACNIFVNDPKYDSWQDTMDCSPVINGSKGVLNIHLHGHKPLKNAIFKCPKNNKCNLIFNVIIF